MPLAQIDLNNIFTSVSAQIGAFAALITIMVLMLVLTWRRQENARLERLNEDTNRDKIISDLAKKSGTQGDEIAKLREDLAEERGARKLLTEQLQHERDKWVAREKEWDRREMGFRKRMVKLGKESIEIKQALSLEKEQSASLALERDSLNFQLADMESIMGRLQGTLDRVVEEKAVLQAQNSKLQSEKEILQAEIATANTASKMEITLKIPELPPEVSENEKELSSKTNNNENEENK